jgi:hypothetical protein
MHLSITQLSELTGKDRRTIKRLLEDLPRNDGERGAFLYESRQALEAIYLNEGQSLDEAKKEQALSAAALNRARKEDIDRKRIPIEIPLLANDQALQSLTAELKAAKGKNLTEELINALLDKFRGIPAKLKW